MDRLKSFPTMVVDRKKLLQKGPKMSVHNLQKFIHELYTNEALSQRYKTDPKKYVDGSDLDAEEKRTILERDYAFLFRAGVHPMLVSHMMQVDQVAFHGGDSLKDYLSKIKGVQNPYQDYYKEQT
jgi:Aromatic-ring-opening dioxygenase LigAB, LigA subunit